MAVHQFWRATGFSTYAGGALELTEFQLLSGGSRVDGLATLTSSTPPTSGSIADLKDGSTATPARWAADVVSALVLSWDFGSGGDVDVTDIRLGSSVSALEFLLSATVQWSDDGVAWTTSKVVYSAAWPGASSLTLSSGGGAPYCRSSAYSINAGSASTVPIVLPLNLQAGSLLLIGINYRGTPTAVPSDWIVLSTTAATSPSAQTGVVYAKAATEADSGTTVTFSQTAASSFLSGYMIELASPNGPPVVDQSATGKVDGATSAAITVLTSGGDGRMAVLYGSTTTAFPDSSATMTLSPASPQEWLMRTVQAIGNLRGAFFTRTLSIGGAAAGTLTSAGSSEGTSFTWNAFLFVSSAGILQNRTNRTRSAQVGNAPSLGVTDLTDYALTRTVPFAISRKDFINGQFGLGIGRISGTTKEHGSPNTPVRCRVRLVRERDFLAVREMWSDATTGAYSFDYVDELEKYTVVAFDHTHNERAVIADNLTPSIIA
ncbi:hypothetical protein J7E70_30265 [Variovorax paradoxus]|nr:hypothetical protein [Variovorax paradoxus]MBT2304707.1 hypothetical protein [Variovorax paradoxus]